MKEQYGPIIRNTLKIVCVCTCAHMHTCLKYPIYHLYSASVVTVEKGSVVSRDIPPDFLRQKNIYIQKTTGWYNL